MPEVSGYVYGSISKLTDYMLSIIAKENNELSEVLSKFNTFFNQFDDNNKSILEEYKNDVFTFNMINVSKFNQHQKVLSGKYLEEIDEYVEDFQADSATGFCDLKKEMAIE